MGELFLLVKGIELRGMERKLVIGRNQSMATEFEARYQPFPQTGVLAGKLDCSLDNLRAEIGAEQSMVYCYVITTVINRDGDFEQKGSAPNFQGDLVTLCTCKHWMRTFMETENWKGKWIAGFTGLEAGNRHNALVYLMKVGYAFESHLSFWISDKISKMTKLAKAANRNKFGDIYEPMNQITDPFAPASYDRPIASHVHHEEKDWHNDINYKKKGCKGRKPALLAGNPDYSFLWTKPIIVYQGQLHRGQKKLELTTLLDNLESVCK